jgi:hypothetical protein
MEATGISQTDEKPHVVTTTWLANPDTCRRKRFCSLVPNTEAFAELKYLGISARRRSLSPLGPSIYDHYGSKEAIEKLSALSPAKSFLCSDAAFRRSVTPARRRFYSISQKGNSSSPSSLVRHSGDVSSQRPQQKPPNV